MAKVKPSDIKSVEDLPKIPILTKSEVQNNSNSLISRGITKELCNKEETSGTTGIPLSIIAEKRVSYIMAANKLRHYAENGGKLYRDRYVVLLPSFKVLRGTHLGVLLRKLGIQEELI